MAGAGESRGKSSTSQDSSGDVRVRVEDLRDRTSGERRSRRAALTCAVYDSAPTEAGGIEDLTLVPAGQLLDGVFYWLVCTDTQTGRVVLARYFLHTPSEPAVSGLGLARSASALLTFDFPVPETNPGRDFVQLPGVETWFWIDPADWEPITATAAIPGLAATVTATPRTALWDPGDGSPAVECAGPGTVYDPDRPAADQTTSCGHVYQRRGTPTASVTVVWDVRWSSTDGDGGALASVTRTTAFDVTVADRQAVGR